MNSIPDVLRTGMNDPNNNLWSPFLGGPKTLSKEDREHMGYDRYGLPFFYTRGANNHTLLTTVEGLMDEKRKSSFHITTLFPPVNTNQLDFNFNTYIFDQHVAGFIPSEGVSPVVTSREESSNASVERRGIALKLDLESLMTTEGIRHYQLSMIQLADTVIRGMQMDAMKKLISARRHDVVWDIDSQYVTMEQVISREISTFMSLQKDSRRLPILLEENKARMMNRNSTTPNMFITHPRTALYATMVADNNINFSKRGEKGPSTFDAGPDGYTSVQGVPVYLSEPFVAPQRGAPLVDPLRHRMEVGEYAIMDSQGVAHLDRRFKTRDRDIMIYDEDRDTWVRIGFRNAMYNVHRFDPITGSLDDTPDEYLNGLDGGDGGGGGGGGGVGDMFIYRDPGPNETIDTMEFSGEAHVCEVFGDMEEKYLTEDELDKVVDTFLKDNDSVKTVAERASSYFPDAYILHLLQGYVQLPFENLTADSAEPEFRLGRVTKADYEDLSVNGVIPDGTPAGVTDRTPFKSRATRRAIMDIYDKLVELMKGEAESSFMSNCIFRIHAALLNRQCDPETGMVRARRANPPAPMTIVDLAKLSGTDIMTFFIGNLDAVRRRWAGRVQAPPAGVINLRGKKKDVIRRARATATQRAVARKTAVDKAAEAVAGATTVSTGRPADGMAAHDTVHANFEAAEAANNNENMRWYNANANGLFGYSPAIPVAAATPSSLRGLMELASVNEEGVEAEMDNDDDSDNAGDGNVFARPLSTGLQSRRPRTGRQNRTSFSDNLERRYRRGINTSVPLFEQSPRWWVRMLFLTSPVHKRVLDKMMEMDVYVPFNIMLFRPNINHDTLSGVMTVSGGEAGFTALGNRSFTVNDSAFDKTRYAHLTYYTAAIMPDERKAMMVPDIYCVGYNGGNDTSFHTQRTAQEFAEQRPRPHFKNGVPSIFAVLVPGNYMPPLMLDIRGRFGEYNPLQTNTSPHYPTANFYNYKYRFSDWQNVNERNIEYFTMIEDLTNTICIQGAQIYMNGTEVKNRGHLGNTYPGCAEVRRGEATQLREA